MMLIIHLFKNCSKLETVTLTGRARTIGEGTFEGCTSLKSLRLPSSIENIGISAFKNTNKNLSVGCVEGSIAAQKLTDTGVKITTYPDDYIQIAEEGPNLFLFVIIIFVIILVVVGIVILSIYMKKRKIKKTMLVHSDD